MSYIEMLCLSCGGVMLVSLALTGLGGMWFFIGVIGFIIGTLLMAKCAEIIEKDKKKKG